MLAPLDNSWSTLEVVDSHPRKLKYPKSLDWARTQAIPAVERPERGGSPVAMLNSILTTAIPATSSSPRTRSRVADKLDEAEVDEEEVVMAAGALMIRNGARGMCSRTMRSLLLDDEVLDMGRSSTLMGLAGAEDPEMKRVSALVSIRVSSGVGTWLELVLSIVMEIRGDR